MNILIDGVFFQLAQSGIARVWRSIIKEMQGSSSVNLKILDRGGLPIDIGIERIPFPQHRFAYSADESALLEKMCLFYKIDVFLSTYFTTPLSVPSVLILHDMIPERLGFDLSQRAWQEKSIAICFARKIICVSNNTKKDLFHFHPSLPFDRVDVAYNGVDHSIFRPRTEQAVRAFRDRVQIRKPYFLLVGSRSQHLEYKNARLFFNALSAFEAGNFDVLCVGGEPEISPEMVGDVPMSIFVRRVDLSDDDLALAYCGALALVYPSRFEGFGMPVVEAMACGCPVITTACGALPEVAGGAALIIDETDVTDMRSALTRVRVDPLRSHLVNQGLLRAKAFNWSILTDAVLSACAEILAAHKRGAYDNFFRDWRKIRSLQAAVDTLKA